MITIIFGQLFASGLDSLISDNRFCGKIINDKMIYSNFADIKYKDYYGKVTILFSFVLFFPVKIW